MVAARVGGLVHTVSHDRSGLLVDGWDARDYASAAKSILQDPDLASRLSAGAIRHAEGFSWEGTADRLLELYTGAARP